MRHPVEINIGLGFLLLILSTTCAWISFIYLATNHTRRKLLSNVSRYLLSLLLSFESFGIVHITRRNEIHACSFRNSQVEGWEVGAVRGWEPRGQILWSNQEPVVHWHLLTGTALYRWVYLRIFHPSLSCHSVNFPGASFPPFQLSLQLFSFFSFTIESLTFHEGRSERKKNISWDVQVAYCTS